MSMALFPRFKRGLSFVLALSFGVGSIAPAHARQAYSTIQANIREEAEIEPYAGGKKVGPVHDWELLCKIETDEELKERVLKSAEEGSLDHVFILACMNMHGKGVEKNQPAAFELFKAAANRGHSNSQNNVGFFFEEGIGTKKDLKQALTWYQKAADYNNPSALCNLGNMYEHGRGVPKSVDEALRLYQKSAEMGNKVARHNVYGIEFERDGKWKLKGIEVTQNTQQPAAAQRTLTYNPATALFPDDPAPMPANSANRAAQKPAESTPGLLTSAANNAPEVKAIAPPVVAKSDPVKQSSANELVLNALNARATPKEKTAALKTPAIASPTEPAKPAAKPVAEPVAQATPEPETKPAQTPPGFVAGTPTLTAILNRLSKGTSLETTAQPDNNETAVAKESKPDKEPATVEEPGFAASAKPNLLDEKKTEDNGKTTNATARPIASMNQKPVETAADEPVALMTSSHAKPLAPAKSVPGQPEEKSAVKAQAAPAAVAQKPAPAKVETKPAATPPVKTAVSPAPTKPAIATTGEAAKKAVETLTDTGPNRPIRDKWALVVGITDFQDPDIPDLQYSAKDATDFYNYLIKEGNFQPDHVRLLLNEQATQRRVLSELGSKFLARVVKPDDLVVLYFSTHGSPSQLDPRGKNYLVASDSDSDDLFATGIEMQKLLDSIQGRVLTDRVLLVMDACHSGFAAPDSKGMSRLGNFKTEDLVQGSGQLVICSSLQDERAWESARYQNGVFTRKLLDGLRSKGTNTSLVEAFTYARSAVGDEVREDRPGAKQTPILKGKWNGNDLVLATPAYAPQTVPASVSSNLGTDSRVDLIASARPQQKKDASDDDDSAKPANDAAPRSGVIYLDSQFFSVKGDARALAKEYHDAIRANASDPELYFVRAKALIQLEDWHNALSCLTDAIQMSPNRARYYLGRAYVNYRLGKKVLAQQDLVQARFYDRKLSNNVRFHQ